MTCLSTAHRLWKPIPQEKHLLLCLPMSFWRMPLGLLPACKLLSYTSLCMAVGYSSITWLEATIKKRQHTPLYLSDHFLESLKVNFECDHTVIGQLCNYKIQVVVQFFIKVCAGSQWLRLCSQWLSLPSTGKRFLSECTPVASCQPRVAAHFAVGLGFYFFIPS